jgi:hypothetical protein
MSDDLEHRLRDKQVFIQHTPSNKVLDEIRGGKKFIIVDDTFIPSMVPLGYMLIDMQYKTESFKTLVPQQLLFYLANPGEGKGIDDALDEIRDFYSDIEKFEDNTLEENGGSVQGTNWAVTARNAYQTYLINKLTKGTKGDADTPVWTEEVLTSLNINDEYVARRLRAIATICLGKTDEASLKKYNLGDVLKHVTINERKSSQLSKEEFDEITCWAGSHYDLKDEYKHNSDVEYRIDRMHDQGHKVGEKITHKREQLVLDKRIVDLETEIDNYRKDKNGTIGVHDDMLLRAYTNITYIAKENPLKQLELKPKTGDANE